MGLVFWFFATGYVYNYLAGIKWPLGFFNKGRRHLEWRVLPTDQQREIAAENKVRSTKSMLCNHKCVKLGHSLVEQWCKLVI